MSVGIEDMIMRAIGMYISFVSIGMSTFMRLLCSGDSGVFGICSMIVGQRLVLALAMLTLVDMPSLCGM